MKWLARAVLLAPVVIVTAVAVAMSAVESSGPSGPCGMTLAIVNTSCISDAQGAGVRVGTPDSWLLAHFPADEGGYYATNFSGYNVERDYAVRGTNTVWWVFCEGHAGRVLAKHGCRRARSRVMGADGSALPV